MPIVKNTDTIEIRKGQRDRMLQAYDYLRSHNFVETTDDVALRMGVNRSSVRSALSRGGT